VIALAQSVILETMRGPIDVHITGPNGSLSDYLGPATVLVAAYLAYLFATKNVKREIAAAEKRQQTELRHDRELQVLAGNRATVDNATEALTNAIDAFAGFASKVLGVEMVRRQMEGAPKDSEDREVFKGRWIEMTSEATSEMSTAVMRINALQATLLRLRLRFPEDHDIYITYKSAVDALDTIYDIHRQKAVTQLRTDEELAAANEARNQLPQYLSAWVEAVRSWNDALLAPN
jgi:hypothetical protein